jgi:hypothetical protein
LYQEAEPLLQRALAIRQLALGSEHSEVAGVMATLAALSRKMGREDEAATLEAPARTIPTKQAF